MEPHELFYEDIRVLTPLPSQYGKPIPEGLTLYTIKAPFLEADRVVELEFARDILLWFTWCQPLQFEVENGIYTVTVKIWLDEWYYKTGEFFDEQVEDEIIGVYTVDPPVQREI